MTVPLSHGPWRTSFPVHRMAGGRHGAVAKW
jgi:hypothetical protein